MVLASGGSNTTVSVYYLVATIGGICLLLGYIANFISPFARRHRARISKLDDMLDGWQGAESRPGFQRIPGVPERLKNVEDLLLTRDDVQKILEHNVAELNKSVKAAHRRQDEFEGRIEQEHGEKIAMLRQVQHDVTQIRLIVAYINMDRVDKERRWSDLLQEQGIRTPELKSSIDPTVFGDAVPNVPTQTEGGKGDSGR